VQPIVDRVDLGGGDFGSLRIKGHLFPGSAVTTYFASVIRSIIKEDLEPPWGKE